MPRNFFELLPLALIALIVLRRAGREKTVRVERLWVTPVLSLIAVAMTLGQEPVPGIAATAMMAVGAVVGVGSGYLRALHLELSIDDKGKVISKATPIGTYLVAGFFLLRFALNYAINGGWQPGPPRFINLTQNGGGVLRLADSALLFSTAMMISQRVEMWKRAQALVIDRQPAEDQPDPAT
jgi:uncharacterized membrane protein YgdD (TMEM256/DUF423 family)